jgi:CheY-like chemotaxis protein
VPSIVTILIADDNADVRRMIRTIIGDLATEVHECANGAEAVAAFGTHHFDWVLMDIQMEHMDGLTATGLITATWPGARVCMVTQYEDLALRAVATQVGAAAYVVKDNLLSLRSVLTADMR